MKKKKKIKINPAVHASFPTMTPEINYILYEVTNVQKL